eukprot:m.50519 g.50519  ORF g.50519 m.50519 type:complete len:85 (-) comp10675_c0_seq3:403-657(-)
MRVFTKKFAFIIKYTRVSAYTSLIGLGKGAPGQPQSKGSYVLPPAPPGATGPPGKPLYPSQDPTRMGARTANPVKGAHQKAVET